MAKHNRFGIYDNGGKSFDRYTVVYRVMQTLYGAGYYLYIAMSEYPFHPQGFGQHGELAERCYRGLQRTRFRTLGKPIKLDALPEQARRCAGLFIKTCEAV